MKIKYSLSIDDLVEYNGFYFDDSADVQRKLKLQKIGLSVFIIVSSILFTAFSGLWYLFLSTGGVIVYYILRFLVPSTRKQLQKKVRSFYENPENQKDLGVKEIELREDGIVFLTDYPEEVLPYKEIFKIKRKDFYLYIFFTLNQAYIVNLRTIQEGDGALFRDNLEKYWKLATA
jgi:hypothetical protein